MAQSVEILPPQRSPLFVVPPGFHPNATFIGMDKELNELHVRLFNTKRREERAAAVLICGGPGSGKTHLAREYVHSHRKDFPGGIFWIDAKSVSSMSTCYWDVAQAAALTDDSKDSKYPTSTDASIFVEQVRHWFESREEWLIVFDGLNFDEYSQLNAFKKYLPFRKNTSIIYTSVDRTLAKKQRLFEPYRLTVRPLKAEEARQLLFDDLDIENPTPEQYKKATEIVHYYQGLPLAIHAIAHRLTATRKPLERYHLNSHLTDQRLAEPFIGIMHDLRTHEHFEAMNLINLLAFFGHHVPVGMISWGKSALDGLPILTSSRPGEPGDLDTTLGVLIQYGLIERISDRYPGKSLLRHDDKDPKVESPESEISGSESFTESMTASGIYQNAIDVIKVHSVVQAFFRDELRIVDGKNKQQMNAGSTDGATSPVPDEQNSQPITSFYTWWLLNATRVFCKSYEIARHKMIRDRPGGCLFVKDLREYETHAERLTFHYRKIDSRYSISIVKETKQHLKDVVRDIRVEIGKISPNASEESLRHAKSIFDRYSSSSSGPSSLEDSMASHRSTWNEADWESVKVQSPVELANPQQNPFQFPLASMYQERLQEQNDGYLTDGEGGLKVKSRRSSADSSRYSEITEIHSPAAPTAPIASVDGPDPVPTPVPAPAPGSGESGWETVQRKKKGSRSSELPKRPKFRGRLRDLGSFRPSPITKMSSAQGEGSMSRILSGSSDKRNPTPTNAKEILASFHKPDQMENDFAWTSPVVSPPETKPSAENPLPTPSQSALSVPYRRSNPSSKPRPQSTIENRSDLQPDGQSRSSKPSPTLAEFGKHHRLNPMSHSDPSLVVRRDQSHSDPNSAPGSRNHSRHPSSVIPASFSRESLRNSIPGPQTSRLNPMHPSFIPRLSTTEFGSRYVPVPEDGMIDVQKRNTRRWDQNPIYPTPSISTSPPRQFMPGGYTSEPLSADMSRDPSGQSRASWQTDPAPATRQISQQLPPPRPPIAFGPQLPTSPTYTMIYAPEGNTRSQAAAYAVPVAAPNSVDYLGLGSRFEYGGEPDTAAAFNEPAVNQSIFFGEHEVDVDEARRRVLDWNLRQSPALVYDPRTGQSFLAAQAPRMQAQRSDPGRAILPIPMAIPMSIPVPASRRRSGSSPDPVYPGLGLGLGIDPRYSSPRNR
ncbi:hypothetical protein TMatcc_004684 [Talaromyces marneffei ATCC 18224]|uniref:LipA and NB-ARC domain protein n=1 Tax=Talaromyces marneffei (strain ATCC 18224 / CBS 334.59 / QM 7333) TaxID=441960 RepID=B6Q353_TALMQ|nr:LipA and NB-ARC domain protein [Talaromyces marneffei ATCC 18224]